MSNQNNKDDRDHYRDYWSSVTNEIIDNLLNLKDNNSFIEIYL